MPASTTALPDFHELMGLTLVNLESLPFSSWLQSHAAMDLTSLQPSSADERLAADSIRKADAALQAASRGGTLNSLSVWSTAAPVSTRPRPLLRAEKRSWEHREQT